jgi:hypothetical protein
MTKEEYFAFMDKPLSEVEKQTLIDAGWAFLNEEYIYIPDDYDGSMAYGIRSIRKVLLHKQHQTIYIKHHGQCKEILEEVLNK